MFTMSRIFAFIRKSFILQPCKLYTFFFFLLFVYPLNSLCTQASSCLNSYLSCRVLLNTVSRRQLIFPYFASQFLNSTSSLGTFAIFQMITGDSFTKCFTTTQQRSLFLQLHLIVSLIQVHIFQVFANISKDFQIQISLSISFCFIINHFQIQWPIIITIYYFVHKSVGQPDCSTSNYIPADGL